MSSVLRVYLHMTFLKGGGDSDIRNKNFCKDCILYAINTDPPPTAQNSNGNFLRKFSSSVYATKFYPDVLLSQRKDNVKKVGTSFTEVRYFASFLRKFRFE